MFQQLLIPIILLLWAGMILGISCLEAWVKFKAPSLTKAIGLDVGRTVFNAFHKTQWILITILLLQAPFTKTPINILSITLSLAILLSLQTFWLFPNLSKRIDQIQKNQPTNKSKDHTLYALIEIIKLCLLITNAVYLLISNTI